MTLTRTIAHNTIVQVIGKIISTIIGLVVIGILTRYLGEKGFGQYTTIMAYLQMFGVIVDMGLYVMLVKKISEERVDEQYTASNIFTMRLISAVVFLGIAPLIALMLPYATEVKIGIAITTVAFLGVTLNQALSGIFQKHLKMYRVSIAEVLGRLALLGVTWCVVQSELGLFWVMVAVVAGSALNFIATYLYSRSLIKLRLIFDFPYWRTIIKETWPIALSIVFNLVYFKADTVILSLMRPEAEVGVYGSSYKVLEVLTTFPAMFAGLILPLLAAAWSLGDRERFKKVLQKAFDFLIMIALPLIGGTWVLAKPVMRLITGEGFADAGPILQILIVATATIFVGNLFGNSVVAINRQRTMMWLYLVVAIISLGGYLYFIPKFSYFGAAGVTVGSEILITISAAAIVLSATKVRLSLLKAGKVFLAAIIMTLTLMTFNELNIFLLIGIGFVEYGVLLLLFRGVTKEMLLDIIRLRQS
ncbi:flippase [Patescibacteria group bacterium]